jgi:sporulation protein YlmC with PRC-barrel domain
MLAILGLAAAPLTAQTQSTTSSTSSSGYIQTSKIIGTKVKTSSGEEIGVVKDVVIDRSTGCMAYTVVSTGGTGTRITGQAKMVSVPWAVYSTTTTTDPSVLTVTVDRDRIYNAPVFDYARINEYSTTGYINNVYSYYGVSAGSVGVTGAAYGTATGATTTTTGTSATGTRTTGTTATGAATTGASATPMATAAPMGTAAGAYGASPSPAASASAEASPAASAAASPKASASPRGRRGAAREEGATGRARTHMSPSESPSEETTTGRTSTEASPAESPRRHREGMREKTGASPAETTESPSGEGKKTRHHHGEESPTTGASPSTPEEQE